MKKMCIILLALMLLGLSVSSAEQMSFPEERQQTGTEVKALADLPKTTYTQREIWLENEGQRIYGIAYIPDVEGKMPLAILSHGLGGSYSSCLAEAEQYASHGIAAYAFDFRGGGGSRSDGSTTQMSVMTEVSDLEVVLAAAKTWDFVDADRIVLNGFSQGGIVSAITAARHVDEVAGLVLCYPALLVHDAVHEQFDSLDDVPDEYYFRIHHSRPRFKDDVENVLIYMATEIAKITEKDSKELLSTLKKVIPCAEAIGYAAEPEDKELILEG